MAGKILVVILFTTAVASVLLDLRQERLQTMHEIVVLHTQLDHHRREMWNSQARIAKQLEPRALQLSVEKAKLDLEPILQLPDLSENKLTSDTSSIGRD